MYNILIKEKKNLLKKNLKGKKKRVLKKKKNIFFFQKKKLSYYDFYRNEIQGNLLKYTGVLKKNSLEKVYKKHINLLIILLKVYKKIYRKNFKKSRKIKEFDKLNLVKYFNKLLNININTKSINFKILNLLKKVERRELHYQKYLYKKNNIKYSKNYNLYLKETKSNFFGTITDIKGNVIVNVSRCNIEDYNKRTLKFHYGNLGKILINKFFKKYSSTRPYVFNVFLKNKKLKRLRFFIYGFYGRYMRNGQQVMRSLNYYNPKFSRKKNVINIKRYYNIIPRAHNGCRMKKRRRK